MSPEQSLDILQQLKLGSTLRHQKTKTSSVTTAWGVAWDEDMIARDIMQNFYDANKDRVGEIQVAHNGRVVTVSAPTTYNLERLFFLGSEKGSEDVGQYGEGFKVASTCLLRDHHVTPVALSGTQVVCMRIANEPVQDTQLFPLVYDFFVRDDVVEGTQLILTGCSRKMVEALKKGLSHFLYDDNPLFGEKLWPVGEGEFCIYESTDNKGHIFYRNLKRGEVPNIPLVLVIRREFKTIENLIKNDRDRKAFGEKLMEKFYGIFARSGLKYARDGQRIVVEAARSCWLAGHPLLHAIANTARWEGTLFDKATAQSIFGDSYFARSSSRDPSQQLRYDRLEREWQQEGRQKLPGYFEKFGVPSAKRHVEDLEEKAKRESVSKNSRRSTPAETSSIQVMIEIVRELAPALMGVFDNRHTTYTVAKTETVLGQLKRDRGYRSREVLLAEHVFLADFPEALAVFLHEHAHIFGYDGDRGFSDALTELLETVVRDRGELDRYESRWVVVRKAVTKERRTSKGMDEDGTLEERLSSMSEEDLRDLLRRVPRVTLTRLLDSIEE